MQRDDVSWSPERKDREDTQRKNFKTFQMFMLWVVMFFISYECAVGVNPDVFSGTANISFLTVWLIGAAFVSAVAGLITFCAWASEYFD